jgi:hypothetical protein
MKITQMNKKVELIGIDSPGFDNEVRFITSKNGQVTHVTDWMKNKVVLSDDNGRNLIQQALAEDYTGSLAITHCELGDGTTAATDNDTDTENGLVRVQKAYSSVTANILSIKFFFSDGILPEDTYTELTMWIDGTASLGTGHLFNRLVFSDSPYEKAEGEDTTVEIRVTLTG